MYYKFKLVLLLCIFIPIASCFTIDSTDYNYRWKFISGNSVGFAAMYDTLPTWQTYYPRPRYGALTWHFPNSNKVNLMFGAVDLASESAGQLSWSDVLFQDRWTFDMDRNLWGFIEGEQGYDTGGTIPEDGIGGVGFPGARRSGNAVTYSNSTHNLAFIFGGMCIVMQYATRMLCNDLWMLDQNQWFWLGGSLTSYAYRRPVFSEFYNDTSFHDPALTPGSKQDASAFVIGKKIYLFAGDGIDTNEFYANPMNDFWSYDIDKHIWVWLKGSTRKGSKGNFGSLGVPSPENVPAARKSAVVWQSDLESGRVYLFGGRYKAHPYAWGEDLNDLWYFENEMFTWIGGPKGDCNNCTIFFDDGFSPGIGIPSVNAYPSSRYFSTHWTSEDRSLFFMLGGSSTNYNGTRQYFNDLWSYNYITNEWCWLSGYNSSLSYLNYSGQYDGDDPFPGSRREGTFLYSSGTSSYIFGGYGIDCCYGNSIEPTTAVVMDDLWQFEFYLTDPIESGQQLLVLYVTSGVIVICFFLLIASYSASSRLVTSYSHMYLFFGAFLALLDFLISACFSTHLLINDFYSLFSLISLGSLCISFIANIIILYFWLKQASNRIIRWTEALYYRSRIIFAFSLFNVGFLRIIASNFFNLSAFSAPTVDSDRARLRKQAYILLLLLDTPFLICEVFTALDTPFSKWSGILWAAIVVTTFNLAWIGILQHIVRILSVGSPQKIKTRRGHLTSKSGRVLPKEYCGHDISWSFGEDEHHHIEMNIATSDENPHIETNTTTSN